MVRHEYDPAIINSIANRPEVRPMIDHVRADGPLDLSPAVGWATQTGIVWLSNGSDAAAAFVQTGERTWDGHIMCAASARGRSALAAARAMLDWMRPYADEIWGLVPIGNRAMRWFARQLGFRHVRFETRAPMGECEAFVWRAV